MPFWYVIYIQLTQLYAKGIAGSLGGQSFKNRFRLTMNYAQKYDLFFPFFIKVVVNRRKAYSFLLIGIMHLQKILLSVIMLRFHFFTAKQGTWVHKDDRGPCMNLRSQISVLPLRWRVAIKLKAISHITLNPSSSCLTCGSKWTFSRTGPKNLCIS